MKVQVKTTYKGPTDTAGAKIVCKYNGKQKTFSYDYSAHCAHESAAKRVLGCKTLQCVSNHQRGYTFEEAS